MLLPSTGTCWKLLRPYSSSCMVSSVNFWGTPLIHFRQMQTILWMQKSFFKETQGWGEEREEGYKSYLSAFICLQTAESFNLPIQKPENIKMSAELIKYLSTDNCWSVWIWDMVWRHQGSWGGVIFQTAQWEHRYNMVVVAIVLKKSQIHTLLLWEMAGYKREKDLYFSSTLHFLLLSLTVI